MPVTELTMEQQFKMRQIEDALNRPDSRKEDIITVFIAMQHQNFVLSNNLKQLLMEWWKDQTTTNVVPSKYGTSSETKN